MIGSIFRIKDTNLDEDGIWNIRLSLCSNNDQQLQSLFERMQRQLGNGDTNLDCFSGILQDTGKLNQAEIYYKSYLKQLTSNHPHISECYHALGIVVSEQKNYQLSLKCIAIAYHGLGDHTKAIESYEKALTILKKNHGEEHTDVAMCLDNMALHIREKHLPVGHSDIDVSYNNVANMYVCLDENDSALKHYELALKTYNKSLRSCHPHVIMTMENKASIYEDQCNYEKAQYYYTETVNIFRRTLPANHSDLRNMEKNVARVSSRLEDECFL
ncbi:unnamed protein product [Rotaria socialis]|uniref:Kinesin light chain n=1 Tax=Rotaria socialis TaxID=392032 RepID=A0A817Z6T2_9BILA|nr:unnamed protein product [Rotaria socialis]CAF4861129.1 unnamed protein product [Rotaria socialis]